MQPLLERVDLDLQGLELVLELGLVAASEVAVHVGAIQLVGQLDQLLATDLVLLVGLLVEVGHFPQLDGDLFGATLRDLDLLRELLDGDLRVLKVLDDNAGLLLELGLLLLQCLDLLVQLVNLIFELQGHLSGLLLHLIKVVLV